MDDFGDAHALSSLLSPRTRETSVLEALGAGGTAENVSRVSSCERGHCAIFTTSQILLTRWVKSCLTLPCRIKSFKRATI
jgi:hypothetical protein